ncbi:hypothetical protein HA387_09115 [Clavibacter michiganensis subsp. michiganensis]|uniref:hypothetical protein n=1 Tax=Clavibacter michiganensis TaxID=28447 RepID=UPI0018691247|nr:hypothetical protein [Clavibacter michiganensis]MBE3078576.1 hypothetical protein [Clavibacter michiganensis subsp. michiganensis]
MRSATRITIGVLAAELVVTAALLLLADRWEDMGWPALGMEHPLIALGFAVPPLIVLTAVVLVLPAEHSASRSGTMVPPSENEENYLLAGVTRHLQPQALQ